MSALKEQLCQACLDFITTKEQDILKTIQSHQEALTTETKSSAGDKHETGRAMLQLEMEKASQQLHAVLAMKLVISRLQISASSKIVKLGSIVITDHANYFLAISAGLIEANGKSYYAISSSSPIGKLLLGKKADDTVFFQKEITIRKVF